MVVRLALASIAMLAAAPAAAQSACQLCSAPVADRSAIEGADRPLEIEISTDLTFNRMARTGQTSGAASLDPRSGSSRMEGGLIDLGGMALRGEVVVRGTPWRTVRVSLPATVTLRSPSGAMAHLDRLETDLSAAPTLDANGELRFNFGGDLRVEGHAAGNFRGRIPISVDYD